MSWGRPNRWFASAIAVVMMAGGLPAPAGAAIVAYATIKRDFQRVTLFTRGHIDDDCLRSDQPCVRSTGTFAPEATAQSKAIRQLHGGIPTPDDGVNDRVQWEVTPAYGRNRAAGNYPPGALVGWRLDIVVDDPAKTGMIEVRRWRGPATEINVERRLQRYEGETGTLGLNFARNTELNDVKWAKRYEGNAQTWCVWAPGPEDIVNKVVSGQVNDGAGHVYFAPVDRTPDYLRQRSPECDDDDDDDDEACEDIAGEAVDEAKDEVGPWLEPPLDQMLETAEDLVQEYACHPFPPGFEKEVEEGEDLTEYVERGLNEIATFLGENAGVLAGAGGAALALKAVPFVVECPGYTLYSSSATTGADAPIPVDASGSRWTSSRANGCKAGVLPSYSQGWAPSDVAVPIEAGPPSVESPAGSSGNVYCGDVISGTVVLTNDVVDATTGGPCTDDGVHMASNATLDLNGYRIIGATAASTATVSNPNVDDAGIVFRDVSDATVTDSTAAQVDGKWVSTNAVSGFDAGIAIIGGPATKVATPATDPAEGNTVEKINIVGNAGFDGDYGEGVHIRNSSANTIRDNVVAANGPYAGIAVVDNSDTNLIESNLVVANQVPAAFSDGDPEGVGIRLEASSAGAPCPDANTVAGNIVAGNPLDGISVFNAKACDSNQNTIRYNLISGNGRDGVRLNARYFPDLGAGRGALNTAVDNNIVCDNGAAGIRVTDAVRRSVIAYNAVGFPAPCAPNNPTPMMTNLAHADLHDDNLDCADNLWRNNVHLSEYAYWGSPTATLPTDFTCLE